LNAPNLEEEKDDPMNKCPPDWKKAWFHAAATKVNEINEEIAKKMNPEDYCDCCQQLSGKAIKKYRICVNTSKIDNYGSGFPLYFVFMKFMIVGYLLMFLLVGIPNMVFNCMQDYLKVWT